MFFLCYPRGDYEGSALRIREVLVEAFGSRDLVEADSAWAVGSDFRDELASQVARSDVFVVVIAPDWLDAVGARGRPRDESLRIAVEAALSAGKAVIPVLVDGATMPRTEELPAALQEIARHQSLEVPPGRETHAGLQDLVATLQRHRSPAGLSSARPPPTPASPAPRSAPRPGILASVLTGLRTLWSPKTAESRPEPGAERVLLAASAPRSCSAGAEFSAALVAYVEQARASALKKLADLGETGDRRVDDVAAGAWRTGAPVTVRLSGEGATVAPTEVRFDWSGRENLAAFSVRVGATPRDAVVLSFQVLVADVLVAFVPMRVSLAASTDAKATQRVQSTMPSSAFASYSSQDAERVTQRLSTLARWAPGLDIFQDCLDLTPGETFKPQLESQIARRDVFLLFWSRKAALSPWVRWEYTTALQRKGVQAILPMPLEDPAIAPPPPELADRHQRDRFMLAGYGLAKVREEAGPGAR